MERTILHCDFNAFYCGVEQLFNPSLRGVPFAVVGDAELRHGIVLSKSQLAKECGVKTGDVLWQARQKCPDIVFVPARHGKYDEYSRAAAEIYLRYTDQVEPYGLDEVWLDVGGSANLFGDGKQIADTLRGVMKRELGLSLSVGVSFNKVFAKLGSDLKKPDATSLIPKNTFKDIVWPLPAQDLLFVGRATNAMLERHYITTIGGIARAGPDFMTSAFGKHGQMLWRYANGLDDSPVGVAHAEREPKSIGNSTTTPHDLVTPQDVKITMLALAESVGARMRSQTLKCSVVTVGVRTANLMYYERQCSLPLPTCATQELYRAGMELFGRHHTSGEPVRSLGLRASGLSHFDGCAQLSLFPEHRSALRRQDLELAVDRIRGRHGYRAISRCVTLFDRALDVEMADRSDSLPRV